MAPGFLRSVLGLAVGPVRSYLSEAIGKLPVLIDATLLVGDVMLAAAALSFLGAGVAPQTTAGNAMISTSRSRRRAAPHVGLVPGVAIAPTALAFRIVGATLRDVADPKGWAPRDPCTDGRFHGA